MDELKVKNYLAALAQDEEFQAQMQMSKTPEDALATVKAHGFDFELEEFKTLMTRLLIQTKQSKGEELTDEELDMVAGGKAMDVVNDILLGAIIGEGLAALIGGSAAAI